jgi:hypothetical protein
MLNQDAGLSLSMYSRCKFRSTGLPGSHPDDLQQVWQSSELHHLPIVLHDGDGGRDCVLATFGMVPRAHIPQGGEGLLDHERQVRDGDDEAQFQRAMEGKPAVPDSGYQ